jgi:hypothetical protein
MKLYEVPKNTWVKCVESDCDDVFKLHHIDGMYSYCHNKVGEVCHYKAWIEVEILDDQRINL